MARVKNPLLSSEARGALGRAMIYQQQSVAGAIVKGYAVPSGLVTVAQLAQRALYRGALDGWAALSDEDQAEYQTRAAEQRLLGINLYIRENLGPLSWVIGIGVLGEVKIG